MSNENNGQKKKFRFNFIDAIVIIVILAAAGIAAYLMTNSGSSISGSNEVQIEYSVEVTNLLDEFKGEQFIKPGDKIIDKVALSEIGEVISVSYSAGKYEGVNTAGQIVHSEFPNHSTMTVTIRAKATLTNDIYTVNGYEVIIGKQISMRAPNITAVGYCVNLVEVDG